MRALYGAALAVGRYEHRTWAIDLVTYDRDTWVAYVFGPNVFGKRFGPFEDAAHGLVQVRREIDRMIAEAVVAPLVHKKRIKRKKPKKKARA